MKTIIYIHGFNSSPQSQKALLTQAFFSAPDSCFNLEIANFPPQPQDAIDTLRNLVAQIGVENTAGFIGSSLGGYYSLYLHSEYGLPAVLINPALRPYELLVDYLGENENLYTGERHIVTMEHMDQLRALEVSDKVDVSKLYLLTQTGDEVLDYYQAVAMLPGVKSWIIAGGDHAFQDYSVCLPSIASFLTR